MKTSQPNTVARTLRLENLETRQFLDAASILSVSAPDVDAAGLTAAAADQVRPIDLSEVSNAELADAGNTVVFTKTGVENVYTMSWDEMEGAASYNVKISRDGGETWITYRKPTESACELRGMYVDNTYMFRIYAVNEAGKLDKTSVVEASFTPSLSPVSRDEIGFTPNGRAREYTMEWTELDGASEYHVRISRDGGETWLQYRASSTATSCTVKGLYAGKTYMFQVVATDTTGHTLANGVRYTVMSPVDVTGNMTEYSAGDTLAAQLIASETATASLKWYAVTPFGDVEIAGTEGSSTLQAENNDYPIKVVATGTEESAGSQGAYVFTPAPEGLTVRVASPYNAEERTLEIVWNPIEGATKYVVQKQTDSGTWAKAAVVDSATTSYTIRMFNPGETKTYRVVAQDPTGSTLEKDVLEYTALPVAITNDECAAKAYVGNAYEDGETVTVNVTGAEDPTILWSYSKDGGETWTNLSETGASYTINAASPLYGEAYLLRAVVVDADGTSSVAYAYPHTVADQPLNLEKTVDAEGKLVMTFDYAGEETNFMFEYQLDGFWVALNNVTVTKNDDGTVTATYPNSAGTMQENEIRVRALDEEGVGVSYWDGVKKERASILVTTPKDVVDPNDGVTSLREALALRDEMINAGVIDDSAAIMFDPNVFVEGVALKVSSSLNVFGAGSARRVVIDGEGANVRFSGSNLGWSSLFTPVAGGELEVANVSIQSVAYVVHTSTPDVTLNFDGCAIDDCKEAFRLNGANDAITLTNSTVSNCQWYGILSENAVSTSITLEGTTFDSVHGYGISLKTSGNSTIDVVDSSFNNCKYYGVYVNGNADVTVDGSSFTNIGGYGIYSENATNATVSVADTFLSECDNCAVYVRGGADLLVEGTTIVNVGYKNSAYAVQADNARDAVVDGCAIRDCHSGVRFAQSGELKVANTLIQDTLYGVSVANSRGAEVVNTTISAQKPRQTPGIYFSDTPITIANTVVWNYGQSVNGTGASAATIVNSLVQNSVNLPVRTVGSFAVAQKGAASPLNADGTLNAATAAVMTTTGSTFNTIDGGDDAYVTSAIDALGNPRVVGAHVDIGACEVQQISDSLVDEVFGDFFLDGEFND